MGQCRQITLQALIRLPDKAKFREGEKYPKQQNARRELRRGPTGKLDDFRPKPHLPTIRAP